jgi:hypothetical protein
MKTAFTKNSVLILLMVLGISCTMTKRQGISGDDLLLTRKYVGNFVDFRTAEEPGFGDPHILWIKTTQDTVYGKISAYSRKCEFEHGDRLFIRRVYQSPGMFGYWVYQIENENRVSYKISEFQYGNKVLAQSWF